jgi:hypothetical protein
MWEVVVVLRGRPQAPRAVRAEFWGLVRSGLSPRDAGLSLGARRGAERWFAVAGGVKANGPGPVSGRYLSLADPGRRLTAPVRLIAWLESVDPAAWLDRARPGLPDRPPFVGSFSR